jgi:hypothetical protein
MSRTLKLKDETPLAKGGRRLVFRHPHDPRLIVKVLQDTYIKRLIPDPDNWRQKQKRYKRYITYLQEAREHLTACALFGTPSKHMQKLAGFVDTDYGQGIVYEAAFGPDGNFAPTLDAMIKQGRYTPEIAQAYEEFRAWLIDAPVVITPLHTDNLVCVRDDAGKPYFILIDGIGERAAVPIKGVFPWLNRRAKLKNVRRFEQREFPADLRPTPLKPQTPRPFPARRSLSIFS